MIPLDMILPEPPQPWTVTLAAPQDGLPAGTYVLEELYCTEPGCGCTNVMVNVTDSKGRRLATLNHSLVPGGFADIDLPDTFLDPLNEQGDLAPQALRLVERLAATAEVRDRLGRHHRLVREAVDRPQGPRRPRRPRSR